MLQYVVFETKRARGRVHHHWQLSAVTPAPQCIAHLFRHPCLPALITLGAPRRRATKTSPIIRNPERFARTIRECYEHVSKGRRRGLGVVPAEHAVDARWKICGCRTLASRFWKFGRSGVWHGTGYCGKQICADDATSRVRQSFKQVGAGYSLQDVGRLDAITRQL